MKRKIYIAHAWECEMSSCWLICDSVADNCQMLLESLSKTAVCLSNKLLLALGAGDDVDNMLGLTVHSAVNLDTLT